MSLMRKIMSILGIIISIIVNRRTDIFFSKLYVLYIYDEPKRIPISICRSILFG